MSDATIGAKIGKYEILRKVGHGGMGRVYEALNPTIGKRVALKLLDPSLADSEGAVARFTREAQAASAASSPHIVSIFDAGTADDGTPFIVMELLDGESLASRLEREGRLGPEETVRIATQLLRGLAKAHDVGIVHRDMKPDNVFLVDREGEPTLAKILDFGVSKFDRATSHTTLTREGAVIGTPAYMSPEQAKGEGTIDARTDLWSVGAIMYECLAGCLPFDGATYEQVIVFICTTDPRPLREVAPGVPDALGRVIERCLERDPAARMPSADAMLEALGRPRASRESPPARAIVRPAGASLASHDAPTVQTPAALVNAGTMQHEPQPKQRRLALAAIAVVALTAIWLVSGGPPPDETGEMGAAAEPASALDEASAPAPEPEEAVAASPSPSASASPSADSSASLPTSEPEVSATPAPRPPPPPVMVIPKPPAPPASTTPPKPNGIAAGLEIQSE